MAIHTEELEDVQGFKKEIEQSSLDFVLDTMQRYQYLYPQKSTIRELTSNAIDAIRERDIAIGILSGKLKVEDYYIERDDPMYKDSNFDPGYYNPKWLWNGRDASFSNQANLWGRSPHEVFIIYHEGSETGKDRLIIEDYGVGLGGRRLEGYFRLAYSTKRNTKHALGKFGIGAKAGLSTAPFYTMTTRYNGREYSFNVYAHEITSNTPSLNMETGRLNGVHVFTNGAKIYYRETNEPNGTRVEVEAKKHYKQLYIDAVKSQLLYFDNIVFQLKTHAGATDTLNVRAKILYEDDSIILSDNTQYSQPHLLINKVNYGYVDFRELELNHVEGNIGIKVEAEDVSVNPSRESVIWNDQTRATVLRSFDKVVKIAEEMISNQLKADDFLEWVKACAEINSRYANSDSILGRLAKIVDLSNAKIRFTRGGKVFYDKWLLQGLTVRLCILLKAREGAEVKYVVKRENISPGQMALGLPTIIQRKKSSFAKDKYMLKVLYPKGFISFIIPFGGLEEDTLEGEITPAMRYALEHNTERGKDWREKDKIALEEYMRKISGYLQESKHGIEYDSIVVPEGFNISSEVTDEQEEVSTADGKKAKEQRAKLIRADGIIPVFTPRSVSSIYTNVHKHGTRLFDWQQIELPVADIDKWDEEEVFYGTEKVLEMDEDGKPVIEAELIQLAAMITRPTLHLNHNWHGIGSKQPIPDRQYNVCSTDLERCNHFFDNGQFKPRVKLIKVAQERRKYFLDFKPIQRFFLDIKGKTLTMSNALIRWNTARIMHQGINKLRFLENFGVFHERNAMLYAEILQYVKDYYRELQEHSVNERFYSLRKSSYDELVMHCDKLTQFQLLVRDSADKPDLIAQAAKELFAPEQPIDNGCAVDIDLYDKYMELMDYATPICVLLNEVTTLTLYTPGANNGHKSISEELEQEIRSYLAHKNVNTQ